jgi:hypothetical protein
MLDDPTMLDRELASLARTVASVLVRVADLPFAFRPARTAS